MALFVVIIFMSVMVHFVYSYHHYQHQHHNRLIASRRRISLLSSTTTPSLSSSSADDIINNSNSECNTCGDDNSCQQQKPLTSLSINVDDALTLREIEDENIVNIVNLKYTDQECNVIAWKCLGYKYNKESDKFELSSSVFPKWAAKYPDAPDLIGITRKYDPETDKVVRNASMDLMRSVPRTFKGGVRELVSVGFKGYKLNELTPNKTRRAQLCNWIIYYREKLFGKTLDELKAEREKEANENAVPQEIKDLPSEQWFQKNRLDATN